MNTSATILNYQKRKKAISYLPFLLFLIWPFALLLTSIKQYRKPSAKIGFILFCTYFGFVFIVSRDIGGTDSARYALALSEMHELTPSFNNFLASMYSVETNFVDIYQPLLTWIVSLFTNNPHYLFALFAFVFGCFYANNLWIILRHFKSKISVVVFIFLLVLTLIIPIWNINGVRMWTAAQVFIYGVLLLFSDKKRKGFLWAVTSILVHFSFLFPVALLTIFILLPKRLPVYFIFFIVSIFISEVNLFSVRSSLSFLPEIFQPRIMSYTNTDYAYGMKQTEQALAWYVGFSGIALRIAVYSMLIGTIISSRRYLKKDVYLYSLVCFTLFFYAYANVVSLVPSGGRFLAVANVFSIASLLIFFARYRINLALKIVRVLSLPLLIFFCIFSIRVGFDYMGISTFFGNPFTALLFEDTKPIIEFIKSLIA